MTINRALQGTGEKFSQHKRESKMAGMQLGNSTPEKNVLEEKEEEKEEEEEEKKENKAMRQSM